MKNGINLIPAQILTARVRRRRLRAWLVVDSMLGAGLLAVLLTSGPRASGVVDRLRSEHESARSTLATAQEQLAATVRSLREARTRQAVTRRIGARPDFSGLLRTVANRLDSRATLEQILIAPLALEGEAGAPAGSPASPAPGGAGAAPVVREQYRVLLAGLAVSTGIASDFVLRLDETGYFSQVKLTSTRGRDIEGLRAVEFQITGTLGEGELAVAKEQP